MQTKQLFGLIHIRNKGEVAPSHMFKPYSNFLAERSKVVILLWINVVICVLCLFVTLSFLFLVALWSPARNELTFSFSCM